MSKGPINKVFSSVYKDEIEKRLSLGQSPRAISRWLQTRGEEISHTTINDYKKSYFNIESEAAKIVKEKQKELSDLPEASTIEEIEKQQMALIQTEVNKAVGTIRAVNHIQLLYENIHDMREYLAKLQSYEPVVAAHAAKGIWQEIRATIETLEKIKDRDGGDDSSVARVLSSLRVKKRELEKHMKENNY